MFHRLLTIAGLVLLLAGCGAANVPSGEGPASSQTDVLVTAQPTDPPYPTSDATADASNSYPIDVPTPDVTAYPGPTDDATSAATADASSDVTQDVVAIWRRAGGFAGFQDSFTVHADGRVEIDRDRSVTTKQIAPDQLAKLRSTLGSNEWDALDAEYGKPFPDAFAYSIETDGKTVQTYDATEVPPVLSSAMQQFSSFFGN